MNANKQKAFGGLATTSPGAAAETQLVTLDTADAASPVTGKTKKAFRVRIAEDDAPAASTASSTSRGEREGSMPPLLSPNPTSVDSFQFPGKRGDAGSVSSMTSGLSILSSLGAGEWDRWSLPLTSRVPLISGRQKKEAKPSVSMVEKYVPALQPAGSDRARPLKRFEEDQPATEPGVDLDSLLDPSEGDSSVRVVPIIERVKSDASASDHSSDSSSRKRRLVKEAVVPPPPAVVAERPALEPESYRDLMMRKTEVKAVCEECETAVPSMRCEACEETLCPRCVGILHPRSSSGEPHDHQRLGCIRALRAGDSSGHISIQLPSIYDGPMDEDAWSLVRDLSLPTSIEATPINELRSAAPPASCNARFHAGDIVVFDLLPNDAFTPDVAELVPAARPPWRAVEGYGRVLTINSDRLGPEVPASTRTDLHELCYLLEFLGYVEADYRDLIKLDNPDPFAVRVLWGQHTHDSHSQARRRAFQIDLKIQAKRDQLLALAGSAPRINGMPASTRFLMLPQPRLHDPADKQAALVGRRRRQLAMLADKYVARVLRDVMRPHFDRIVAAFEHHRQQVRAAFATVIQKYVRRHFYRHLLDKLRDDEQHALWLKGRALHAGYKYVTDPEQQRQAYTVNDNDYFMTVCEIRRWFRTRQVMAKGVLLRFLRRKVTAECQRGFGRWKAWVQSLDPGHIDADPSDVSDSTVDSIKPSFHPAYGLVKPLPPLPETFVTRGRDGTYVIENATSYNSFVAAMSGPTDKSAWVIKDSLLMGATPSHSAPRMGGRSEAESLVLSGIGTFICLLEESELIDVAMAEDLKSSLEAELRFTHKSMAGILQAEVVELEHNYRTAEAELRRMRERFKRQPRNRAVREKETGARLARKAMDEGKARLARLQPFFDWHHCPIRKDGVPDLSGALRLVESLEERVRKGHRVYVFSSDGHGRSGMVAACVLGRLYSLPTEETLERIQLYHDCGKALGGKKSPTALASVKPGQGISCPYTFQQAYLVRKVLLYRASEYEPVVTVTGPPLDPHKERRIRSRILRMGYPTISQEEKVVKLDEQDEEEEEQDQGSSSAPSKDRERESESDEEKDTEEIYNIWVGY